MMLSLKQIGALNCFEGKFMFDTTSTGVSDYIIIPPDVEKTSVQLQVLSTAEVTIEATLSTIEDVTTGTATWLAWDNGYITNTVSQDATKGPVGAVRIRVKTALAGNNAIVNIKTQGEFQ